MYYYNLVIDNKSNHTDNLYTYKYHEPLKKGTKVKVTFGRGNGLKDAYVIETGVTPDIGDEKIKAVCEIDEDVSLSDEMLSTALWMVTRYGIRLCEGINLFMPKGSKAKRKESRRIVASMEGEVCTVKELTPEQESVCKEIFGAIDSDEQNTFLLHGVTGSGKTEVYMQAIEHALSKGKTAIMLVPEIALTKQITERFIHRFGSERLALLHSKLTARQRYDEWHRIKKGEAKIVIGARMAVFAPLDDIGLIIMDEEHESTYKADMSPKYETVDIAYKRLMSYRGTLILGSATPSIVSYKRAEDGTYKLLEMSSRYNNAVLPDIELIDMKQELRSGNPGFISNRLYTELRKTVESGRQAILFLNRRGYSNYMTCHDCGHVISCPNCNISLTYHKNEHCFVCHYCDRKMSVPEQCPQCGSENLRMHGIGTEKVEEYLAKVFPDVKVERLDLDTASKKGETERIINNFASGKTRVLIGTQMVAKGLDFKNVDLVGVILADSTLNIPDFRSSERTFQLVTQVAGRAGRGEKDSGSRVMVQTYDPSNMTLKYASNYDYKGFYSYEINMRKAMDYPPYTDIILVEFTSEIEEMALNHAKGFYDLICKKTDDMGLSRSCLFEPRLSSFISGNNKIKYYLLIKSPKENRNKYIYWAMAYKKNMVAKKQKCNLIIDVNPYGLF